MFSYPVVMEPDDGTIMVTFPDFPEAVTAGNDEKDALAKAVDALETVLIAYVGDRRDIPEPSPANGRPTVAPGLLASLKLSIYVAMRERGWRKGDLARAMAVDHARIDRLLDLRYASTVAQIEQALLCLRGQCAIELKDAP